MTPENVIVLAEAAKEAYDAVLKKRQKEKKNDKLEDRMPHGFRFMPASSVMIQLNSSTWHDQAYAKLNDIIEAQKTKITLRDQASADIPLRTAAVQVKQTKAYTSAKSSSSTKQSGAAKSASSTKTAATSKSSTSAKASGSKGSTAHSTGTKQRFRA